MAAASSLLPGVVIALGIAIVARIAAGYTQPIPDVVLALFAGLALNNTTKLSGTARPGTRFVLHYVLRTAIILLGAGLTFAGILSLGAMTLVLILVCVAVAMTLGTGLAKLTGASGTVGILIGAGTAICGASAILAVGPLIAATDAEIAYAVTTIFTFNIVALLVYPILGHALGLDQISFGSWVGTAVNDTSVVVATGYVYGQTAGATATVVKLTRTLLLIPLAFAVARLAATGRDLPVERSRKSILRSSPWFILGFAGMALLNSLHVLPPALASGLVQTAAFLIVVVLAAVGLNVDLSKIRTMGFRPLAAGFALATVMAVLSLGLIHLTHIR
jgi:uncharacterized integral membrane protein (TIGR00698 family)